MSYLIIAILCVIISGVLFKKASGTISLHSPNMMSIIFYFYFLLENVIGAVLIVNKLDDHDIVSKLTSDIYRYQGFWAIMYTIVMFPVGQLLANRVLNVKNAKKLYYKYINSSLSPEWEVNSKHIKNVLIVLSFVSLIAVVYTLINIGGSPLRLLGGASDAMDLAISRIDASRNFGGSEYFRNLFGILLTPMLSYIAYGYKRIENNLFNSMWFWSMLVGSVLILTYNLEKSPLLWYILGFVFFKVYLGYRLSTKTLVITFSGVLGLLVAMYILIASVSTDALFVFNQGIVGRLILTSCAGLFISFNIFPQQNAFLGFSSFSSALSSILGLPSSERAARMVMEFVNPTGVEAGLAGVYNSLFVSEAWANWGLIGVLLSPIYVGFMIQLFYIFFLKHKKTPFLMGLMVYYTIQCGINGGVNDYIYNISVVFVIIIVAFVYSYKGTIRIQRI